MQDETDLEALSLRVSLGPIFTDGTVRLLPSWFLIHAGTYQSHGTTTVPKFRSFGIASVGLFENGVPPNPMINHHFSIKTAISWD